MNETNETLNETNETRSYGTESKHRVRDAQP